MSLVSHLIWYSAYLKVKFKLIRVIIIRITINLEFAIIIKVSLIVAIIDLETRPKDS